MCFGGDTPKPETPATPPPPPPVLDQAAPDSAAPTAADDANKAALGIKKYKTSSSGLGIPNYTQTSSTGSAPTTNTGLGITM